MEFNAFYEEKGFPYHTSVGTASQRREILNDRIANACVTKIDFFAFLQLIA